MFTVLKAWTQHGWSASDHLINDSKLEEICGRSYSNRANMMRAAAARSDRHGYVAVEYLDTKTGEKWRIGGEPDLPGRPKLCKRI